MDLQPLNNVQCGELERLAAAAATMDYTESLSPVQHESSQVTSNISLEEHPRSINSQVAAPSRNSAVPNMQQVISYIDYQVSKDEDLVPIHTYNTQTCDQDPSSTMQSMVAPRVVMVRANNIHPPTNVHFTRPVALAVSDIPFHTSSNENCIQTTSYPQIHPSSSHIIHYAHNIELEEVSSASFPAAPDLSKGEKSYQGHNDQKQEIQGSEEVRVAEKTTDQGDGEQVFSCNQCKVILDSEGALKQHQTEHIPKRNGLALELKIEIIKRINAGESKADMAEEYGVNTSTIKSVMKKADSYLACWKKGMFNPESKRLKGPKREDVEEALFSWYKQALGHDAPISGPILCAKAQDFAKKLGHTDFKPTHGWLDRFKKRKKIVFGRSSAKRKREDKVQECMASGLPQLLIDYESNNIFAFELLGLYYRALPPAVESLRGNKCAGGIKSKERMSLILCTNMTGSEKFPLLVAGRCKYNTLKYAKNLPVHFIYDEHSWLTMDTVSSWLLDMDSWFVQQGRKIILMAPASPVYSNPPRLRAIKFIVLRQNYPSPLRQVAVTYFKIYYRKKLLEEIITASSKGKWSSSAPELSVITYLQLLYTSWQSVSESLIVTSFQNSGITKYGVWSMIVPTDNVDLEGAREAFNRVALILKNSYTTALTFEDFVHFDDSLQVCNLMGDDDILASVKGMQEEENSEDNENLEGDVNDTVTPSFPDVENALGVLRKYIQYQEGAQEMFRVLAHLEYVIYKNMSDIPTGQMIH